GIITEHTTHSGILNRSTGDCHPARKQRKSSLEAKTATI
ncbi:unnamed protein product, partial [Ixodes pacificus]